MEPQTRSGESGRYPVLSKPMEVVDAAHFSGVVEILHRATSSTLRTSTGDFLVQPSKSLDPSYLLALSPRDEFDLSSLTIDGLEFHFGETVFSIDRDSIHVANGAIHVQRPLHLYSSGIRGLAVDGVVSVEVLIDGKAHRLSVCEFCVDEVVVVLTEAIDFDLTHHPAIVHLAIAGSESVPCEIMFRGLAGANSACLQLLTGTAGRAELVRAYSQLRFPRLRDRGSLAPERVIELFRVSHYLSLRETESGGPTEEWCRPSFAGETSIDTVYRAKDGALLGHVSVTRAYSKTWLGHQLTTLKGHAESVACRAALYNHFATIPAMMDGSKDSYLLGYYDPKQRWHQLFFEAFVDWVGDLDRVAVLPFDRFEPSEMGAPQAPTVEPEHFEIRHAEDADIAAAVTLIGDQMPALAVTAFDINEEALVSDCLHPDYEARGVERGRHALVAYQGETLVAVALCETGSPHLSLFNLFNLGHVYTSHRSPTEVQAHADVQAAMFRAVRRFYADRGIFDPVLVAPPSRFVNPGRAGLRLDETMGCIIWSGETLEQYQSYVRYCFEKIGSQSLVGKTG